MSESPRKGEWSLLDTQISIETGWYDGGFDLCRQPDGSRKRYYWAALPPAVVVVPLLDDDVVFIEQYRPAIRRRCLELPAGIVERVADPETANRTPVGDEVGRESYASAAIRELREETGYRAETTTTLESFWCATGVLRHRRGVVVAEDLEPGARRLESNEFIELRRVPRAEAVTAARKRPVNDASLEALLLAAADGFL